MNYLAFAWWSLLLANEIDLMADRGLTWWRLTFSILMGGFALLSFLAVARDEARA